MTMTYCGRCGSANGSAARYCRQCGAELSSQAAFSSSSTPLNVEFSARTSSAPAKEPAPAAQEPKVTAAAATESDQSAQQQDAKAISESLRRIRASGPLLVEAAKKKQERISQIISDSIEGFSPDKAETPNKKEPAPATVATESKAANTGPLKPPVLPKKSTSQAKPALPAHTSSAAGNQETHSTSRRPTGSLPTQTTHRSTGSLPNTGHLPPSGPASVLVQASGLKTQSSWASRLRVGVIIVAVALAASSYFLLRDRWISPSRAGEAGRNLMRAADQSANFVQTAVRDRDQGRYEQAAENFRNALLLTPTNSDVMFQLAQTYVSLKQNDDALKTYQSLLRIAPEHLEARLQLAEIHRQRGNWNAAYQEYQRIIALNQNSSQAAAALDVIEAHQAGKPEVALNKIKRPRTAPINVPTLPPGVVAQPQIVLPTQRPDELANIKAPGPNTRPLEKPDGRALADPHKKLGVRYFNIREYRAAINEFLAALRITPEDKDLLYFLGSSYRGLGQNALAYEYYIRVDSGPYKDVCQKGAKETEKAAREEYKRREALRNEPKNEVKTNPLNESKKAADDKANGKNALNNSLE